MRLHDCHKKRVKVGHPGGHGNHAASLSPSHRIGLRAQIKTPDRQACGDGFVRRIGKRLWPDRRDQPVGDAIARGQRRNVAPKVAAMHLRRCAQHIHRVDLAQHHQCRIPGPVQHPGQITQHARPLLLPDVAKDPDHRRFCPGGRCHLRQINQHPVRAHPQSACRLGISPDEHICAAV